MRSMVSQSSGALRMEAMWQQTLEAGAVFHKKLGSEKQCVVHWTCGVFAMRCPLCAISCGCVWHSYYHPRFVWVEFDPTTHRDVEEQHHHHHGPALCWSKGLARTHKYKVAPAFLFDAVSVGKLPATLKKRAQALQLGFDKRCITVERDDGDHALAVDLVVRPARCGLSCCRRNVVVNVRRHGCRSMMRHCVICGLAR